MCGQTSGKYVRSLKRGENVKFASVKITCACCYCRDLNQNQVSYTLTESWEILSVNLWTYSTVSKKIFSSFSS